LRGIFPIIAKREFLGRKLAELEAVLLWGRERGAP